MRQICNYRDDTHYRHSFNRLAHQVFNMGFEEWYEGGFWDDRYIPHSYADGGEVVANVSLNVMDVILNGRPHRAAQLGTIMTHPNYRRRGLAGELIRSLLKDCSGYELIYVIGDRQLRDYYPRFGFRPLAETRFILPVEGRRCGDTSLRRLNTSDPRDLDLIHRLARMRRPISRVFGVDNAEGILMWYCFNVLSDCFHYWEERDTIVVFRREGSTVHLFDVIGADRITFDQLLPHVTDWDTEKMVFHFTPDRLDVRAETRPLEGDDILFVTGGARWESLREFKHPTTAQA
ncbi:MAG: GNAT family N-acetyltransferase [Bacillota bacterium]